MKARWLVLLCALVLWTAPVRAEQRYSYLAASIALMAVVPVGIARAAVDELRILLP